MYEPKELDVTKALMITPKFYFRIMLLRRFTLALYVGYMIDGQTTATWKYLR